MYRRLKDPNGAHGPITRDHLVLLDPMCNKSIALQLIRIFELDGVTPAEVGHSGNIVRILEPAESADKDTIHNCWFISKISLNDRFEPYELGEISWD